MDDLKVYHGDQVKALDDGAVGGYLVRYSDPDTPDLYGDFFTAKTYFGRLKSLDLYYDHGFDGMLKGTPVGTATLKFDDVGVWMEAQIQIADEYAEGLKEKTARSAEKAIKNLVELGKLGLSSGAVGHLVRSEPVGKSYWLSRWPLGEASLTPRPAEPKNKVQTLKSFQETPPAVDLASVMKSVGEGAAEVHIHYHQTTETNDMSEKQTQTEEVKKAPESEVNVEQLVADQVAAALKADREAQAQAKAAAEAEEKRINEEVDKRLKQYATSRTSTTSYAIRTEGIIPDNFPTAFKWFITHKGDTAPLRGLPGVDAYEKEFEISRDAVQEARAAKGLPLIGSSSYHAAIKASNATDMNIGTAADGGDTVPTGFYNQIIMRRDELALHTRLGCRNIPGVGTTVDVPLDNEADGEFVSTNEASQFDQDAPAVSKVSMTLAKYSKRTLVSDELLQDTGVNILGYVQDRVAIGWAKTVNNLLVTEAVTGTQYLRGGSTTGFAAGEPEQVIYNGTLAPYADGFDLAWVMRSPSYGTLIQITGNDRLYGNVHDGPTPPGVGQTRSLLGYPVYFSNKVDAIGARAKSLLFGAWSYMMYREGPSLNFLYDPYTLGDYGQARLLWYMRWDFELSQAAAVGYFEHDLT